MKTMMTTVLFCILSTAAFADSTAFFCERMNPCTQKIEKLNFSINGKNRTITIQNKEAFGVAEIVANEPLGITYDQSVAYPSYKVNFEYEWYYTAAYSITVNPLTDNTAKIILDGNDYDGIEINNEEYSCTVKE